MKSTYQFKLWDALRRLRFPNAKHEEFISHDQNGWCAEWSDGKGRVAK